MSNYYTKSNTYSKAEVDSKIPAGVAGTITGANLTSLFNNNVGATVTISDGTYNIQWVVYTKSGNYMQLFPLSNLKFADAGTIRQDVAHGEIYVNLFKYFGFKLVGCALANEAIFNDIASKTGKTAASIASSGGFWLATAVSGSNNFLYRYVQASGAVDDNYAGNSLGGRPLITVVK